MKLVLVRWIDSSFSPDGWRPLDVLREETEALECRSVGWLAKKTKKTIVIVPHLSGERNGVRVGGCGDMTIPRCCILKMKVLK